MTIQMSVLASTTTITLAKINILELEDIFGKEPMMMSL
jgi:hypothetical protein